MKKVGLVLFFIMFLYSCSTITLYRKVYSEGVEYVQFSNGEKDVKFVGMVHFGKKNFYRNVVELIKESKNDGYVLFYEYIDDTKDSTEIHKRKVRKILGFCPNIEGYKNSFKDILDEDTTLTTQNNDIFLNIVNNKDYNVDVIIEDIVRKYESKNGEIILDDEDINTPLTESIENTIEDQGFMEDIVLGYRNFNLAKEVQSSNYNKIIILYGMLHIDGFFKELKKLDTKWKKIDEVEKNYIK